LQNFLYAILVERLSVRYFFVLVAIILTCSACQTEAQYMRSTPRVQKLFEKTKTVCFGRFVVDVPATSLVLPGSQAFGVEVQSLPNGAREIAKLARQKRDEVQAKTLSRDRAEIVSFSEGPTYGSWTLRYWNDYISKKVDLQNITAFLASSQHGFVYSESTGDDESAEDVLRNVGYVANHLRARDPSDMPLEPGVCLDIGFIADDTGRFQEIFGLGLRFPDLPDVSFSILSNKNADQGDSFEERRAKAKNMALLEAPMAAMFNKIKTLREGKLKVSQGEGSEALFRRPMKSGDGAWHEFQFEYAGTRLSHRDPPWGAVLFTGVDHNQAGSAPSGLTDDEAMALWDKLMSTVRLRVAK
jgi:hypothetical protein